METTNELLRRAMCLLGGLLGAIAALLVALIATIEDSTLWQVVGLLAAVGSGFYALVAGARYTADRS